MSLNIISHNLKIELSESTNKTSWAILQTFMKYRVIVIHRSVACRLANNSRPHLARNMAAWCGGYSGYMLHLEMACHRRVDCFHPSRVDLVIRTTMKFRLVDWSILEQNFSTVLHQHSVHVTSCDQCINKVISHEISVCLSS